MSDFDPNQYLAEKTKTQDFNPDQYLQEKGSAIPEQSPEAKPEWSKFQSLGQGALQGATAGFSDEIGGAAGALMEKGAQLIGKGSGDKKSLKELYQEYRDLNRKKNKDAEEANPGSYLAGNIGGGVGSALLAPAALVPKTIAGAAALGAATGLGTSEHDLTEPSADALTGTAKDVTMGGALGTIGSTIGTGVGKVLNPIARKMGQAGQSLFGKAAKQGLDADTESFANTIVNSIKNEKSKLGEIYNNIMDANQDKKIDLTDFATRLKQRADAFDPSLPDQARDKKAIMSLVQKIIEGPEIEQTVTTGFKPGKLNNKEVNKFMPGKTVDAVPSAQEQLESEGNKLIESQRQLGNQASQNIVPSEDNALLTRIFKTNTSNGGPSAVAKTVENTPSSPSYSTLKQISESTPFSQEINPITETRTIRQGGSLTPDAPDTKTLRTNLGNIANERNLSASGEKFANETYSDLTNTLKDQIPDLKPTDAAYSSLLKAGKKLGIKGNDEDVIRVLQKITSDNQGKEILVNQALDQLDKVNPNLVDNIKRTAKNIDQKADMIDKISGLGNYNVLNPKQLIKGLVKDMGGIRAAAGNAVGLVERKLIQTPAGELVQKAVQAAPEAVVANPFSQSKVQQKYNPSEASKVSTSLYNATDDSLKDVASKFKSTPGLEFYADHINRAIDTNDSGEKNRAIFLIMQNPKARKLITPEEK